MLVCASPLNASDDFPFEVNADVARELDFYLTTSSGRNHIRASLRQMRKHEDIYEKKLEKYQLPDALLAVGIVESGFANLTPAQSNKLSAGVWQMIPATARLFGLVVNSKRDDRLNVEKATDGAFKYLKILHEKFHDWRLALMAYNAGDVKIQRGIAKAGTRDPWRINKRAAQRYLARVMAVAIVMKNPQMLDAPKSASNEIKAHLNQL
jgi:hypothetical protein